MSGIATIDSEPPAGADDPLLRPFRLRHLVLRNRIVSTSHASMLDDGGLPLERYQRYHEEKALGGLALTMFGGSAMTSPDSNWGGGQLDVSTDGIVPHFQALAARIHRHGAAAMCQISHLGRRASSATANWLPAVAPSRVRETRTRSFPREMDAADIRRIVADYGAAALRCKEGGLDGLETVTGGHLIGQFLSPRTNHRSDGFGGSLENRVRFGLMVHEEIRRRVGDQMIVGIRFVIDEGPGTDDTEDGLDFEQCLAIARIFEREGQIDFFNCIFGRMDNDLVLAEHNMPGMAQPHAPFLDAVGAFKRETRLPVFHSAGIRDIATARDAVARGLVDMVGMTRAHIADPHIVNKLMAGQEATIRPCVGASYCLYKKVNCIHNAASGRETTLSHAIDRSPGRPRKVLVVGGGPAGLEAARVSAERGHEVVLLEAGRRLGGQVLAAAAATPRRELIGIIDWRESELARLGVRVRLQTHGDAAMIGAERPDIVVIATGGVPDLDWFPGADLCNGVADVLTGRIAVREEVLVYDGTGRHPAVSCALHLAEQGHAVRFVSMDETLAAEMPYPDRVIFRKRFAEERIPIVTEHRLVEVVRAGNGLVARFCHELTGAEMSAAAGRVVVENGTMPVDALFRQLRDLSANDGVTDFGGAILEHARNEPGHAAPAPAFELHRIGDAVASRDIHAAILDAQRLCARF
ncbi:2,4-dienoyl-CoA reductase-like NADH-dependent reductase (Old Yellow Enzyme family) [Stella humosa]|uniref:2,4-dienoyl-CoA reductase-like NADH-dependent reductase (Old Yellow Enzyme family) n=1 Tax=Stella humosa TaxID=94 RepID=A0A3N1KN04_9PROT|nr:NADH:flavin oxidoreductase [Stella humosa]ROP83093.1 2,4-dienoyl-CoA reductase-like NADH-dependent reductase (Old Yellow Enzyme family) [Stella humosa]BBK30130.1 N-methylproline demethylase [Stella humosa]